MTAVAVAASWVLDARRQVSSSMLQELPARLRNRRRTYASYMMHLALACLAIGVAGSSLGTQQREATLSKGESLVWAGRNVRFVGVLQHRLPEKLVVQAELEVTDDGNARYTLLPAQEYHFLQNEWSTKVAIHSTWSGDFYTILHSGQGENQIQLTLVDNPLMRWIWLAGWLTLVGAVPWFYTPRRHADTAPARKPFRIKRRACNCRRTLHQQAAANCGITRMCTRSMNEPQAAIRTTQLSKAFDGRTVLNAIDLEIAAGESVALVGANGAGKTTLLSCLASVLRPDRGEVRWFGRLVGRDVGLHRLVGMVTHETGLYSHLTLRENLIFAAKMGGIDGAALRADRWLDAAGLTPQATPCRHGCPAA